MNPELTVGLSPFCEYANTVGIDKHNVVRAHRARYDDPTKIAWWPYQGAHKAVRAAIATPATARQEILDRMIAAAPRNMGPSYVAIAEGLNALLKRKPVTLVPTRSSMWVSHGLGVTVDNCLGLRRRDGSLVCAFPYYKAGPLTASVAATIARLLEHTVDEVLPGATPMVLEVRAGKLHQRGNRRPETLDTSLGIEAQSYVAHWRAVA